MNINIKIIKEKFNYQDAMLKMIELSGKVFNNEKKEEIWILQHEDVYTMGGNGSEKDILDKSLNFIHTNRGGKVTFHGEGQIVCYFILKIKERFNFDLHKYVDFLHDIVIETLFNFKIKSYKKDRMIGVWVKNSLGNEEKICAIGVRVSKGISTHGIALNVCTDLLKFSKIIPCGIENLGVCSMESITGRKFKIDDVINELNRIILKRFN